MSGSAGRQSPSDGERDGFTAEQRRLLREAVPPVPLDQAAIQAALERARGGAAPQPAPRAPADPAPGVVPAAGWWRPLWVRGALVAGGLFLFALAAAGVWRWDGMNSRQDLQFGDCIRVLQNPGYHSHENGQAAIGRLHHLLRSWLKDAAAHGRLAASLRDGILAAVDEVPAPSSSYRGGFEELSQRGTLTSDESAALLAAVRAGIGAIRQFRVGDSDAEPEIVLEFRKRLRAQVEKLGAGARQPR